MTYGVWDRWDKLVTGARTKDTGIVKQYKPSRERWRPWSDGRLGREDYEQAAAKYACGFGGGVRMCMINGALTKLHDRRKELAAAIGGRGHQRREQEDQQDKTRG